MSRKVSPAMIGSFVVSGIVLIVAAVILLGSGAVLDRTTSFVAYFPGSVNGLTVGSNVAFRGVRVGTVTEVLLALDESVVGQGADLRIPVVFELDQTVIRQRGIQLDLDDPAQVQDMLDRGLSARLETESIVTGRLYVALDFRPGDEPTLHDVESRYPQVPTVRSPMAEVGAKLQELANKVADTDVDAVFLALRETLDGVNSLVNSEGVRTLPDNMDEVLAELDRTLVAVRDLTVAVDSSVGPMQDRLLVITEQAEVSMSEVDRTLETLQATVDPNAPLVNSLVRSMQELELTMQSLRRLAEMLERNPSMLIRGRDTGGDGS